MLKDNQSMNEMVVKNLQEKNNEYKNDIDSY